MKIATPSLALFLGVPGLALAQSKIRIPTDAEQVGAARAYAARSEAARRCVPQRPHRDRHRPLRSSGAHDGRSSSSATEEGTSPTRSSWSLISFGTPICMRSFPAPTALVVSSRAPPGDHFCARLTISENGKPNGSARSKRLPLGSSAPTGPGLPMHSTSPSA